VSLPADDATLVARAIAGDRAAFVELFRHHGPAVAKLTRAYGAPASEAEDIVQEVFLAAWRRLADYDRLRPFRAWLFAIALNRVRDMARRRKVRAFFFGATELDEGAHQVGGELPDPETQTHHRLALEQVSRRLDGLPEDLRTALVLTAVTGLSYQEAAASLNITVKALEGRITRARKRLSAT
jgi:RNA polymerase sigma-70 factor (ECF subfamily)